MDITLEETIVLESLFVCKEKNNSSIEKSVLSSLNRAKEEIAYLFEDAPDDIMSRGWESSYIEEVFKQNIIIDNMEMLTDNIKNSNIGILSALKKEEKSFYTWMIWTAFSLIMGKNTISYNLIPNVLTKEDHNIFTVKDLVTML